MSAISFKSIAELRESIVANGTLDAAYAQKMLHKVPEMPIVKDRAAYLIEKTKDKVVLDIGCTGHISQEIRKGAKKYYGIDKTQTEGAVVVNLDHRPDQMPKYEDVEIIVCSEILEHLANPGYFLMSLKQYYGGKTIYITVPNAGAYAVRDDCEIVHFDHVCWYSYTTLKTLLMRYGFEIKESRWYGLMQGHKNEGIIAVVN